MASLDEYKKHIMKHNVMGLVNAGIALSEAIDLAFEQETEPLFPKKLRLKRPGQSTVGPGSAGGSSTGPGGTHGGATGG